MKIVQTSTKFDTLSGEVLERTESIFNTKSLDKEPAYIKLYINDIGMMQGLTKAQTDVLHLLARRVTYEGVIEVTPFAKQSICKELDIKPQTFANCLSVLKSSMMLQPVEGAPRQVFTLNPFFFGKGEWKDIIEQRKAFVIQITKAYGMELPQNLNPVSFVAYKSDLEKQGQQRLIE